MRLEDASLDTKMSRKDGRRVKCLHTVHVAAEHFLLLFLDPQLTSTCVEIENVIINAILQTLSNLLTVLCPSILEYFLQRLRDLMRAIELDAAAAQNGILRNYTRFDIACMYSCPTGLSKRCTFSFNARR